MAFYSKFSIPNFLFQILVIESSSTSVSFLGGLFRWLYISNASFFYLILIIFMCEKLCATEAMNTGKYLTDDSNGGGGGGGGGGNSNQCFMVFLVYHIIVLCWKSNEEGFSFRAYLLVFMNSSSLTLFELPFQLHNDSLISQSSPHLSVAQMKQSSIFYAERSHDIL